MSVFLDSSKKRKVFFRGIVVAATTLLVGMILFFGFNIFFSKSSRPIVKYTETTEDYHFYFSAANKNKIALTFDDGPRPEISMVLMDVLEKNDAPATFFYVGQNILIRPDIVYEAAKRGFDIGNHSFTHQQSVHESQNRTALELHSTGYLLSHITGQDPIFYRPPFLLGIGIDPTINPYTPPEKDMLWALEAGFIPIGADIDTRDWLATSSQAVIANAKNALTASPGGHILMLHEEAHTVEAMPELIAYLREQGYTIVPLTELILPPQKIALSRTLLVGSTDAKTGGEVSKLQWFLYRESGFDPYLITGTFGTETRNALLRFQVNQKLIDPTSVDPARAGIADAATRDAIEKQSVARAGIEPTAASLTPSQQTTTLLVRGFKTTYIQMFPIFRKFLEIGVLVILVLVIARCGLLFTLIFIGWRRKKKHPLVEFPEHKNRGISVLIPAYNEAENIRSTVESALMSLHQKKEIIVIDDGSTDATGDIVKSVIAAHPDKYIKLLQIENGGKARALNYGIEAARYDIFAVLDADAVIDPNALHHFIKHFSDPEVGAVAGKVHTTGSKSLLDLFQALEYAMGQNIDKYALSVIGSVGVVPGPAGAWRKKDVLAGGGFSTDTLVEDQDMTLTLLRHGKKVLYEEHAVSYTETPRVLRNFLKQRFRWIYGTMQCFWKHKRVYRERPLDMISLIVLPNVLFFNILLPLIYPFADSALLFGLIFNDWHGLLIPFLLFTAFDLSYGWFGVRKEKKKMRLLVMVPLQRLVYRQLLYITVARGLTRAIEGIGLGWNKFVKLGETQRFYFSSVDNGYSFPPIASTKTTFPIEPSEGVREETTTYPVVTTLSEVPGLDGSPIQPLSGNTWASELVTDTAIAESSFIETPAPLEPTSSK